MKQSQQQNQKQLQKQGYFLSQQHLKLMHLMHLTGYALQEYLYNEVEQNPALEVEKDINSNDESEANGEDNVFDPELFNNDDELFEKKHSQASHDEYYEAPVVQYNSLQENLKEQIKQMNLADNIIEIACYIIDELNDDGYLRIPLNDVADDYGFAKGKLAEENLFEEALIAIQSCDPAGVASRDLRECLLLQITRKLEREENTEAVNMAKYVLENYYDHFTHHNFNKLKHLLNMEEQTWNNVLHVITHLNPKPITESNRYELMREQIIPDFEVTIDEEDILVSLAQTDAVKLKVNSAFEKSLSINSSNEKKQAENYFSKLIEDAELLVMALQERETTMLKVITAIVSMQQIFFKTGDIKNLRPMILQDISVATGYEVSTISRITSNKYVQTPHGIFALKNLFMRNINHDAELNSQHTAVGIQDTIKQIILAEDKNSPLSDNEIARKLEEKGMTIARRTVVKYREALGIPNSGLRKH